MTSTSLHQTTPDTAPADLPPLPIAALMIGVHNLLQEGADLPQPRHVCVSELGQHIDLQFRGEQSGQQAITQWAHRFGGATGSQPYEDGHLGPRTFVTATFGYCGLDVRAYAFIPADPATD